MKNARGGLNARRQRGGVLWAVAVATTLASCRGGNRAPRPTTPAPAVEQARRDSAKVAAPDSASMPAQKPDSTVRVAGADSVAARADTTPVKSADKRAATKKPAASKPCVMDFSESPPETRLLYSRMSDGISNTFIGGGFVGHCQGENNRLRADSAEQFQAPGIVNLYGNVVYEEPNKVQITATHATYFTREGRLYADGNVVATQLSSGSSFIGPSIEYFRSTPERPLSRLIAPSRSTARLVEKDSSGRAQAPTVVTANRFEDAGDSLLMAWGDVQIDREKINARSDSAAFDKISERSRLVRSAKIVNKDTAQQFTLVGDTIDLFSTDRKLNRVVARHKGVATSDDLVLTAETIDVRLKDQQLEQAFAFGAGRAKATTPQQDVMADSMSIRLADKQLREVRAIGDATAAGTPDSLKMRTKDKDLLRGDSILAFFDSTSVTVTAPAAPGRPDSSSARVKEIRALGNASSLFHFANAKGITTPPSINYVRGVRIFVHFDSGTVQDVRVDSAASGVFLEAAPDSLSDTTAGKPKGGTGQGGARPTAPPRGQPQQPPKRPPGDVPPANEPAASFSPFDIRRRP